MKASIIHKLESLTNRYQELNGLLSDPEVIGDQNKFRDFSKEYSDLEPVIKAFFAYQHTEETINNTKALLKDNDSGIQALAKEELYQAEQDKEAIAEQIQIMLLPKDPNDTRNIFLEVRAGTGGDEAAIFTGDLFRMYSRFAELKGWQVEIMQANESEHGGFKEIIARISGQDVYSHLKFESGAHRVQRVPETESQGRIHTSACTVAVLPEIEEVESIEINPNDLRIDTYRASGAGGQHVNKTDSAIRITHIPTGTVVECQDERSQHKNRARAMSLLQARLVAEEQRKQTQAQAETRRIQVGTGDRSERIRTYNFPQGRVTDHRINLTLYKLADIMSGNLAQVIEPLIREHQAEELTAMGS